MNDLQHLNNWFQLPDDTRRNIFAETGRRMGLPAMAAEKDWWVVHTLALIFAMDCAPALVFKGGTSLSKGWNLIERFSEDIDLALDKKFLGFTEQQPGKKAINHLRRLLYDYIVNQFVPELAHRFTEAGFQEVEVKAQDVVNHDQDPLVVEIYYPKLSESDTYLKPGLLVEIGSRSLREPFTRRTFSAFVGESFQGQPFADIPVTIPVVNPERTFLEKIFLLHEEFQRSGEKVRVERLSRHLYDICRLWEAGFAEKAISDRVLWETILEHRRVFVKLADVDYALHRPGSINFLPPQELLPLWEADYKQMKENMIYGDTLSFNDLIERLSELQNQINNYEWN